MPQTGEYKGTNADGSSNEDCYKDGKFTQEMTMEQMVEHSAQFTDEINEWSGTNLTVEEMKDWLRQFYPTLKRWRKCP